MQKSDLIIFKGLLVVMFVPYWMSGTYYNILLYQQPPMEESSKSRLYYIYKAFFTFFNV